MIIRIWNKATVLALSSMPAKRFLKINLSGEAFTNPFKNQKLPNSFYPENKRIRFLHFYFHKSRTVDNKKDLIAS